MGMIVTSDGWLKKRYKRKLRLAIKDASSFPFHTLCLEVSRGRARLLRASRHDLGCLEVSGGPARLLRASSHDLGCCILPVVYMRTDLYRSFLPETARFRQAGRNIDIC